ncbi:hypothetical protein [Nonomuraea sp. NPDC003201]
MAGEPFELDVTTDYPHGGVVTITARRAPARPASIILRDPEWSQDTRLSLNGAPVEPAGMTLTRTWQPGDRLELTLDLRPRVVRPDHRVDAIRGCVAVRRGPEVLALESVECRRRGRWRTRRCCRTPSPGSTVPWWPPPGTTGPARTAPCP